jgi:phenylacetate-coenzyme A ligase PaaK-like adenylate-forming protein
MGLLRVIGLNFSLLAANKATPEKIARIRERRFRRLLRTAVAQSRFYRELYRGIDIETCQLADLPTVDKPTMMANFDDFVTDRRLRRAEITEWLRDKSHLGQMYLGRFIPFQTSGTTGENALVVYDRRALDFVHAALIARHALPEEPSLLGFLRIMFQSMVKKTRIAAVLMTGGPYPAYTAARYPPPLHGLFVKEEVFSLLDPVPTIVEQLNAYHCDTLFSYPSLLDILAREQLAGRLHLKFTAPLSAIASGSEPLTDSTRRLAQAAWGRDVQDTYGSSECFIMARSCGKFERMHVSTDLCCMEIVDRHNRPVPDGQTGDKVLLTNLFNLAQPFIRYEVSDVTGYSTESCSCGQPFPTLLPVEGRTDDIFYIDRPGGGYDAVHPYLFLGPIVELAQVREYQLAQTGRNEVTFAYASADSGPEVDAKVREVLETGMRNAGLLDRMALKTTRVESIPRDPRSGKLRQIISRVGAPPDLDDNVMRH